MSEVTCNNHDCTFGETGICVLDHQPDSCPHRISESAADLVDESSNAGEPAIQSVREYRSFKPNGALGIDEIRGLMRDEYCHVVGILGEPDSGKTAYLVSLYLLLSRNGLDGFTYADSRSLMALDELSRGARSWDAGMPEQMTSHTVRGDGRSVGFLHLKIVRQSDRSRINMLIPDLPGEWTTSLIDGNRTDRLSFLKSAEEIWIMVDGRCLANDNRRHHTIHRTNLLVDRLVAFLDSAAPALRLVVSRRDLATPARNTLEQIINRGALYNITITVHPIASFSENPKTNAGTGFAELITSTFTVPSTEEQFWPDDIAAST